MAASITWLGHATVRLVLPDGRVAIIDPWLTDNPACPAALKHPSRCDIILVTHGHYDHVADIKGLVERFDPLVLGNYELCTILGKQIGSGRFEGMNTGGTLNIEGLSATLTKAFHSSSIDAGNAPVYAGMPNGWVVQVPGLATIYDAGDTDVFGDMELIAKLYEPKVCILPIGDRYTMGARGAALAAQMLQPTAIIPVHYKTFPLLAQSADEFRAALPPKLAKCLLTPDVGQDVAWTAGGAG